MGIDDTSASQQEFLVREYEQLKAEQIERIKLRDSFINLNIVAVGFVAGFLASHTQYSLAWLAIPWICSSFGWFYVMNDEKVSALQRYFTCALKPSLPVKVLGWETFERRKTRLIKTHKIGQLLVEESLFVLPSVVSVVAYVTGSGFRPWFASVLAGLEILGGIALAVVLLARSDLVTRFDIRES
jgi:hypothetical protein